MNAVFRRRLGLVFLLVGIALLFTYAPHWAPVALGIFLVLNCLVALKKVGFRYRYIWGMVLGGFFIFSTTAGDKSGFADFMLAMLGFNAGMLFALYMFFHQRLQTEGRHLVYKAIIGLTVAFVIITDIVMGYAALGVDF